MMLSINTRTIMKTLQIALLPPLAQETSFNRHIRKKWCRMLRLVKEKASAAQATWAPLVSRVGAAESLGVIQGSRSLAYQRLCKDSRSMTVIRNAYARLEGITRVTFLGRGQLSETTPLCRVKCRNLS